MHLLIVNYEYPPVGGGASNASCSLAKTLTLQGHRVSVMTSAFGELRGLTVEDGIRVHRIPARRRHVDRSDLGQMLCFAGSGLVFAPGIVRAERVEGVIAFFTLPSGLVGYWLKARYGVPYVVSMRGGDVPGLDPEVSHVHRRIRWLRQRVLGSARKVVANSPDLAELSESTDPYPVTVIRNGVDSAVFHPLESAAGPDACFRILFVGRLREQKNLKVLIEQLARLRREGVNAFRLDVVGDGPLTAPMHDLAERFGLGDNVVWHGWAAKPEVLARYQSADCFVNPSTYEGLPNAVLEAMACSLPVVASRVGGNDALVIDQKTGFLFPLDEPDQLGDALTSLIRDKGAAQRMGAAGRAQVVERFSWNSVATAFVRLFEEPTESCHRDVGSEHGR